jgi:hypothetical protein
MKWDCGRQIPALVDQLSECSIAFQSEPVLAIHLVKLMMEFHQCHSFCHWEWTKVTLKMVPLRYTQNQKIGVLPTKKKSPSFGEEDASNLQQ